MRSSGILLTSGSLGACIALLVTPAASEEWSIKSVLFNNAAAAAEEACSTGGNYSEQEKRACEIHVLHMKYSMRTAENGSSATLHLDHDDSDDTGSQKAAKQAFYAALDNCSEKWDGGELESCRLKAFHEYHMAMGGR